VLQKRGANVITKPRKTLLDLMRVLYWSKLDPRWTDFSLTQLPFEVDQELLELWEYSTFLSKDSVRFF